MPKLQYGSPAPLTAAWPLRREDQRRRRRRRQELDLLESRLAEPGAIVGLPPGGPFLREHRHVRVEEEGEGMAGAVVVQDEVVDEEGAAGLERRPDLPEGRDVRGGGFLVGDVAVDDDVVFPGAEIRRVEVAVDRREAVAGAVLSDDSRGDAVDGRPVELGPRGWLVLEGQMGGEVSEAAAMARQGVGAGFAIAGRFAGGWTTGAGR